MIDTDQDYVALSALITFVGILTVIGSVQIGGAVVRYGWRRLRGKL